MHLVLVSRATGVAQFVTVDDNPSLRSDVQKTLESASVPLGVIAWTTEGEGPTGSKMIFPWVTQDPVAVEVFDRICEEAWETYQRLHERNQDLEAENERLRDCIRWLEPDVKDIDAWMKGCKVAIQKVKEIRERGTP